MAEHASFFERYSTSNRSLSQLSEPQFSETTFNFPPQISYPPRQSSSPITVDDGFSATNGEHDWDQLTDGMRTVDSMSEPSLTGDLGAGTPDRQSIRPDNASLSSRSLSRKCDDDNGSFGDNEGRPTKLQRSSQADSLRVFAMARAIHYGLSQQEMVTILEFSKLSVPEMLIQLQINLLVFEKMLNSTFLKTYTRSPDFKTRLRNFAAAALLAVDVRAYGKGMMVQLTDFFEKNLGVLCLPPSTREDPVDWGHIKSSISEELTMQRSSMKEKLDTAIANKHDIFTLTRSLLVYDIKAKTGHYLRFAFLRQCLMNFNEASKGKKKKNYYFFDFVDDTLANLRREFKKYPKATRAADTANWWANVLRADKDKFKTTSGALSRQTYGDGDAPDYQRTMETAVARFIVDDDDDIEENNRSEETATGSAAT